MKLRTKKRLGVKWNLFLSFILFSVIMLILLWLFQIVFLDRFYRDIKTAKITGTAETIASNIDNPELATLLTRLAQSNDVSILILSETGAKIGSANAMQDNMIQIMPPGQLLAYFQQADQKGGSYLEIIDRKSFHDDRYKPDIFSGPVPKEDQGLNEAMIFARIATMADGTRAVILLNAVLTPVSSTVETLRTQLLIITSILVILSLLLAMILSKRVARPIVQINKKSKELAKGNYQVAFEPSGYKEIAELADTLNHAAQELNQVETLRRELIANVSHDLRTPLTMISGYAEVMRDLPGENNPENVQVIIDEARRLAGLVNDILDLSKLQAGSQKLELATYNLTGSIRTIISRYSKLIDQEGYNLHLDAEQDAFIHADERRIEQVLYNLINNAINYTGEDKQVTIRQTVSAGQVRIEIIDSGEGIPAEQLPHIWDRYYKIEKTHHRAIVGTGLGLSIVKGALDMHHAAYGVDSKPDQGSIFWFQLPAAGDPEPTAG